ncbi:hypothetical protein DL766_009406 [Monosporascus sp. MC13-8B]|uniref:Glutathione S-transferase n=1 Tax=Monosporascus cannonballus TaxID=155416 RepID=A0ABY0HAD8_9PEZI|nr:hypothetical protein DL762_003499 [Monosporascus cannonballus]RYO98585.1 hypothetical protein DL763_002115 [Monosporascus cannonballus]RYP15499.1 hypothetical protein DL766_009406 [Monosporascus sp. MC13-8B]
MAPFGKIYTYPGNYRVQRAQVVAALNGLEVTVVEGFKMGETNKSPEFLSKFPMGKVPALECADGFCLAESAAIAQYLASAGPKGSQLLGADPKTQARVSEWLFFSETELSSNLVSLALMSVLKMVPYDEGRYDTCMGSTERACKRIETALAGGKKHLVGDELTLADIMVGGVLFSAFKFFIDAEMRKDLPNTVAWMQNLAEMKEFKDFFGTLEMCETRAKA